MDTFNTCKNMIILISVFSIVSTGFTAGLDLSGGDSIKSDVSKDTDTENWGLIYGTAEEGLNLSTGEETVFTWHNSVSSDSAVLASEAGEFSGDINDLSTVSGANDLVDIPKTGTDKFSKTYTNTSSLSVIDSSNTVSTKSETFQGGSDNLFVYSDTASSNNPVWAGRVNPENAYRDRDYEILIGRNNSFQSVTYELFLQIS